MANDVIRSLWRRWLRPALQATYAVVLGLRPALAVVLVSVLLSAAFLWLVDRDRLATLPQIIGHDCGVAYPYNDPLEAQRCLWQAYVRCQAATLVFVFPALDEGTTTHTITVQHTAGRCALTDTTYHCARLTHQGRGLLLVGCGREGNLYLPPRPVDQIGVVCGEVDNVDNDIGAGYGGVDGFIPETVARVEGCFWQAYTTCTQPYTLIYSFALASGPTYTFVVQRQQGTCELSLSVGSAGPSQSAASRTYSCGALTHLSNGGLVAHDCGAAGTITVPPETPPSQ
jgi:hypothetical protein